MRFLFFGVAIAVLVIDLVTKTVFTDTAAVLIPNIISIQFTRNLGAAFSMFSGGGIWLIMFTSVVIGIGLFAYFRFKNQGLLFNIACALILGGAIGNLCDRIFLGSVRDFIQLDFINFPIFNFADIALNIGVALLVVWLIFIYRSKDDAKI